MKPNFDDAYKCKNYFGTKHDDCVEKILDYKKSGIVLDLGVGEGRNALFLAEKGFQVIGVDKSEEAIKRFTEEIKLRKLEKTTAVLSDIVTFEFKIDYDVIISNLTLHFIKEHEIKNLIQKMKEHTKKEGINVITIFTEDNPVKDKFVHLFKKKELYSYYADWKILDYKEYKTGMERHGEGPLHYHWAAEIIAEK